MFVKLFCKIDNTIINFVNNDASMYILYINIKQTLQMKITNRLYFVTLNFNLLMKIVNNS